MTLARTALRLAAINALQGADANSGPTVARNRVFDSRIGDLTPESNPDDALPTVIVLTDSEDGEQLSRSLSGPPFRRLIDLVFEIGIVQRVQDEAGFALIYPDTDARLEAALDTLEFQIARRLSYDPAPQSVLFRNFVRPQKHECHRQVTDEAGIKIACRLLTWTCEVNDDQVVVFNTASTSPTIPTGLDVLPEPLRSVAKALPSGSSGHDVVTAIAAAIAPLTAPPARGVDFTITNPNNAPNIQGHVELSQDT